jgi:hypothetical protein
MVTDKQLINLGIRHRELKIDRTVFAKTQDEKKQLKEAKKLWNQQQKKN